LLQGSARLTLEFFADGLPEKKLQLSGISMLLILLSRGDVTSFRILVETNNLRVMISHSSLDMIHAFVILLSSYDLSP
jgi:hypothetical protein